MYSSSGTENNESNGVPPSKHLCFWFKHKGNHAVIQQIKKASTDTVEFLTLAHTQINDDILDFIIEQFIQRNGTCLKELDLSGNQFTDEGIEKLLKAIKATPHCLLQKLTVTGNTPELKTQTLDLVKETFKPKAPIYAY